MECALPPEDAREVPLRSEGTVDPGEPPVASPVGGVNPPHRALTGGRSASSLPYAKPTLTQSVSNAASRDRSQ